MRRLARPLVYLGTAACVISFGWWHGQHVGGYRFRDSSRFGWSLAYAALLCVSAYSLGLPDLLRERRRAFVGAAAATVAGAAGISMVQLVLGSQLLPRFVVFSSALVLVPWYAMCARLADDGRQRDSGRDRVLAVVGPGEAAVLEAELAGVPERPASLVGVVTRDEGGTPGDLRARTLLDRAIATRAGVVVLDRDATGDDGLVDQAAQLHERGVRIRTLALFYDEWLGKLPVSELERVSLMFDIGELHRARYGRVKRVCDVIVGAIGLVPLAAMLPIVIFGNLVANRGPMFYRQRRIGRNGQPFSIIKFRTMMPGVDATHWTERHDPRVTGFGAWLRRTHLDELPQLWNVLRGDLSLVGPRPEQQQYVEELRAKIAFYDLRHLVRPGITGWAQVKYPYGGSELDALEKLQYEFWYLRHQNVVVDLRILARTARNVIGRSGR